MEIHEVGNMNHMEITTYREMNESRSSAAAAVVNEKIFCACGWDGRDDLNSVECYDPSSDVWTLVCNMPQRIWGHRAVEIDRNFIVMGGTNGSASNPQYFNNVWALDTMDKNAKWICKPFMSIPRYQFGIAKIHDEIFICGGQSQRIYATDLVTIFDGEVWRDGPKMPTRRSFAPAVVIPMEFIGDLKL